MALRPPPAQTSTIATQDQLPRIEVRVLAPPNVKPPAQPDILRGTDFEIPGTPKRQANMLVFGDAKTGKSSFCLRYAPDPIAFINYDHRARDAAKLAKDSGKRIYYTEVDFPANITKLGDEQARKFGQDAIDRTMRNFDWAVTQSLKGNVRTICLDTGTELGEIIKLAVTGRIDRTKGDYGKSKDIINRQWWRILNLAREGSAHLIVLSRAKAIWMNNEPTGRFTYRCPEVVADGVDFCAQIRLQKPKRVGEKKKFELEVTAVGVADIEEMGSIYKEDDWEDFGPFVYACVQQYPGSTFADWG